MELPQAFVTRMCTLLGEEAEALFDALQKESVRALRVNTNKITPERFLSLCPFPVKPLPFAADGFLCTLEKAGAMPMHHAGMFYLQDASAMSCVHATSQLEGATVLDLCAAPGGKASQLSAMVGEGGFLLANEYHGGRCRILSGNLERLGCRNTMVTNLSADTLAAAYPACFDLVLVDAPCSGEGMFRKDEGAISEWSEENVFACAKRQAEILESAAILVKDGGELLYSTCTFSTEENERMIDAFLQKHGEFSLIPVEMPLRQWTADGIAFEGCHTENITECRRVYPHNTEGEGQFIARLRKAGEQGEAIPTKKAPKTALSEPSKEEKAIAETFLGGLLDLSKLFASYRLCRHRENLVLVPNGFFLPVPERCVFSVGVTLGTIEKGRLVPHHAFFMAFGAKMRKKIELSQEDPRLFAYLKGEEIPCDGIENGYAAVLTDGCTLGFGKVAFGRLKNHYPKGLRLIGAKVRKQNP